MQNLYKILTIVLLLVLLLNDCNNKNNTPDNSNDTLSQNKIEFIENSDFINEQIFYRFPTAAEMLTFISNNSIYYKPGITNSTENLSKYFNSEIIAYNLGIYLSDMAYLSMSSNNQDINRYFIAIQESIEKLNFSNLYSINIIERIERNIDNIDSLINISNECIYKTITYLENNEEESLICLMSAGAWLESMYLAIELTGEFSTESPYIQGIADQKYTLEYLYLFLEKYKDKEAVTGSMKLLDPIRIIVEKFKEEYNQTKIEYNKDGKLEVSGGNVIIITENQFKLLSQKVKEQRNKVVNSSNI